MAQPVWVLSVDLQTKTATFQTGMADAAKAARGSFGDIKSGASEMGTATTGSMRQAREGVMLLGEQFGIHLPRALTTFIAELGPVGAAVEAAFPFLAVAALAGILIEHLTKLREAGIQLTDDQEKFGTAAQNAFNDLDKKLIQAGITADDLSNNHLDALHKKLQLIDMQSMEELDHAFGILQKAADAVFKDLDSHWYTFGTGSVGAKHALDQFQTQYESLLAQGKDKEASDLLSGTRDSAKHVLDMQKQAAANTGHGLFGSPQEGADISLAMQAQLELKKSGAGYTEKEIAAQQQIVDALNAQVTAQERVAALTHLDKGNATKADAHDQSAKRAAAAKEGIATKQAIAEQQLAADKSTADASLTIHHASVEARLAVDIEFAGKDKALKEAANQQEIAALNKSGKDYAAQLKALQDNALKITADYSAKVVELKSTASVAEYNRDISQMEQAEALKIGAQKEGTAERMAVIDSAIKEERAKGLESTQHFQELLRQREGEALKEAEVEKKLALDSRDAQVKANQQAAESHVKQSNQKIQTQQGGGSDNVKQIATEKLQEQASFQIKHQALQQQLALYEKGGQDRIKQAQEVQAQLAQLEEDHVASVAQSNAQIAAANRQTYVSLAQTASGSLMQVAQGHQSLAATVQKFAQAGLEHVLAAIFEEMVGQKSLQMARAESAAAGAYTSLSSVPIVGPVLGAVAAATVFAGAMAFEKGGVVPGVGKGDTVPAMLSPGEGIVPGGVMDGLRSMARSGGMKSGPATMVQIHQTNHVSTIDGDGMSDALDKHADQLQAHFNSAVRRTNP
jgi:hypothetical protein